MCVRVCVRACVCPRLCLSNQPGFSQHDNPDLQKPETVLLRTYLTLKKKSKLQDLANTKQYMELTLDSLERTGTRAVNTRNAFTSAVTHDGLCVVGGL